MPFRHRRHHRLPRLLGRVPRPLIAVPVALTLAGMLAIRSRGELADAGASLRAADSRWLLAALLCQLTALGLIALNYGRILRRLGHRLGWATMARAHLRRYAVATLVPFGGPASFAVFARDLAPAGVPGADAVSAVVLYSAASQIAFVLFLVAAAGAMALTTGFILSGVALALALPLAAVWIALLLLFLRGNGARVARRRWVPRQVAAYLERLESHALTGRDLALPVALCLAVNLTGLGMLAAALLAVGQQPSLTSLVVARLAAQIASHLLPVMQGSGMVELSTVSALQEFGMHAGAVTAGTLLYRLAQFWLPLTLGLLLLLNLGRLRGWLSGRRRGPGPAPGPGDENRFAGEGAVSARS